MPGVLNAPRTHPVGVLVTHIPLAVLWIGFAVHDLADGSVKSKGREITRAEDTLSFYVAATIIVVIAVIFLVRILQAGFALADKRDA